MEIFEHLEQRLPATGEVQRSVLFGEDPGARHLSAVLVRLPPAHEFALHTHPGSEDCFFVLSGAGEALEPGRRLPIAAPAGVWIPDGQPHGLRAGDAGMLEVGFQSPAGHTAVPFERAQVGAAASALRTHSLVAAPFAGWRPAFPQRGRSRFLDAEYAALEASAEIRLGSAGFASALVIASGEVEIDGPVRRRLSAFALVRLDPGARIAIRAATRSLLVAVKARATARV